MQREVGLAELPPQRSQGENAAKSLPCSGAVGRGSNGTEWTAQGLGSAKEGTELKGVS